MTPHPAQLAGRRVLVLGLGAFGGGAGCARRLARLGADVTATDLRPAEALPEAMALLEDEPLRLALGGHQEELFQWAEWVVVNPAVPAGSSWLAVARRHGCRLTDDVSLAAAAAAEVPALGITGTHGKSSTASLAAHLLRSAFSEVVLSGNLGGSLLAAVDGLPAEGRLVAELSSFQTERLQCAGAWPQVAALTCLGRDHLERHGGAQGYAAAKRRLLDFQDAAGVALLPWADPAGESWARAARGRVAWFAAGPLPPEAAGWEIRAGRVCERWEGRERDLAPAAELPFAEPFRLAGAVAAVAGARLLGLPAAAVREALHGYQGLPHRMEALPAPPGVVYLDNGVATHPEPTLAALRCLPGPVALIAGGQDKGLPLEELAGAAGACRRLHLFGAGGRRLAGLLPASPSRVQLHSGAREAVEQALAALASGETLLFSPSFSSYDEFRNFRDRARVFRDLCRESLHSGKKEARHVREQA